MVREIREYVKCKFTNLKLFCLKQITDFFFFLARIDAYIIFK